MGGMNREAQRELLTVFLTGITIGYQSVLSEDQAIRLVQGLDHRLGKTGHAVLLVSQNDPNPDLESMWEHAELIGGDHE